MARSAVLAGIAVALAMANGARPGVRAQTLLPNALTDEQRRVRCEELQELIDVLQPDAESSALKRRELADYQRMRGALQCIGFSHWDGTWEMTSQPAANSQQAATYGVSKATIALNKWTPTADEVQIMKNWSQLPSSCLDRPAVTPFYKGSVVWPDDSYWAKPQAGWPTEDDGTRQPGLVLGCVASDAKGVLSLVFGLYPPRYWLKWGEFTLSGVAGDSARGSQDAFKGSWYFPGSMGYAAVLPVTGRRVSDTPNVVTTREPPKHEWAGTWTLRNQQTPADAHYGSVEAVLTLQHTVPTQTQIDAMSCHLSSNWKPQEQFYTGTLTWSGASPFGSYCDWEKNKDGSLKAATFAGCVLNDELSGSFSTDPATLDDIFAFHAHGMNLKWSPDNTLTGGWNLRGCHDPQTYGVVIGTRK